MGGAVDPRGALGGGGPRPIPGREPSSGAASTRGGAGYGLRFGAVAGRLASCRDKARAAATRDVGRARRPSPGSAPVAFCPAAGRGFPRPEAWRHQAPIGAARGVARGRSSPAPGLISLSARGRNRARGRFRTTAGALGRGARGPAGEKGATIVRRPVGPSGRRGVLGEAIVHPSGRRRRGPHRIPAPGWAGPTRRGGPMQDVGTPGTGRRSQGG